MTSAASDVQTIENNFNDFGQSFIDTNEAINPYLSIVRLAFVIIYALTILFVSMGIIGIILVKVCRIRCCRSLNHIGWIFTSWMVIISLLLGIILWGVGLVLSDSCLAVEHLVTPTELANIIDIQESAEYIAICLDTSISVTMADTLNVSTEITDISDVDTSINSYVDLQFSGGVIEADFTALSTQLNIVGIIECID